jgi:hypothetical protein
MGIFSFDRDPQAMTASIKERTHGNRLRSKTNIILLFFVAGLSIRRKFLSTRAKGKFCKANGKRGKAKEATKKAGQESILPGERVQGIVRC